MIFIIILSTTITGTIIGLFWSLALNLQLTSGLLFGCAIGFISGILLSFQYRSVNNKGEVGFVLFLQLGLLFLYGIVIGLVAWLIRFIFF